LAVLALSGSPSDIESNFDAYVRQFGKSYASAEERTQRLHIFSENMDFIEQSNAKNLSFTLGLTPFTDLSFSEWRDQFLTGFSQSAGLKENGAVFRAPEGFEVPESVDWVEKGAVTSIKDQGQCGSCWTFSATGALEGALFVAGRPLTELSQQEILDCDKGGNKCGGGGMDQAFAWVKENGLCGLAKYPYQCSDQNSESCTNAQCNANCDMVLKPGDVSGFTDVGHTTAALEAAVAQQPVSVAIEADQPAFQHYTQGVLTDEACGSNLDHGVLVVGYGEMDGKKYWKVKNSWGTSHGVNGYWFVERGSSQEGGECGIRMAASFPTVKHAAVGIVV